MRQMTGNLLEVKEGILVQGCNAQGVMGSGVAAAIRAKWPGVYDTYRRAYEKRKAESGQTLELGRVIWHTISREPKLTIANAITQEFYGRDPNVVYANYEAIGKAFERVGEIARQHQLEVHYPLIGAGLANGDWNIISSIIEDKLQGVEHTLWTLPGPTSRPKISKTGN